MAVAAAATWASANRLAESVAAAVAKTGGKKSADTETAELAVFISLGSGGV